MKANANEELTTLLAEKERLEGELGRLRPLAEVMKLIDNTKEFIRLTEKWDEHPEDYDGPCMCALCRSYGYEHLTQEPTNGS